MAFGRRWQRLMVGGGLALLLSARPAPARQQAPDAGTRPADPGPATSSDANAVDPPIVDPVALARIRRALEVEPRARLEPDQTFYMLIIEKPPTFADYLDAAPPGWADITSIEAPSAGIGRGPSPASTAVSRGGFDMLSLVRSIQRARREREARQIRERIDRELEAFQVPEALPPSR